MKRKFFLWALAVLIAVAGFTITPDMVRSTIPSIYYVTPNRKTYENIVNCTGVIQSGDVRDVFLEAPIIPNEILVSVGDRVTAGDTLVRVNVSASQALANNPISAVKNVTENLPDFDENTISAMFSAYGLSAILGQQELDIGSLLGISGAEQQQSVSPSSIQTVVPGEEKITAPISGIVTAVNLQEDIAAPAGKAVLTILDNKQYKALVSVGEADISKIQLHDAAVVRGVGFAGKSYEGVVSKIYPTAHKALSGTSAETVVDVEITLFSPDDNLKPGFSTKTEIIGGNRYNLITVPYEAIRQDENNNEYVYTYDDGKLSKITVITGQELTNEVEILEGLHENSIVIYNPDDIQKEGTMISIKGRADVD